VGRFTTEQDVYDHIGRVIAELVDDPRLGSQIQRANTVVQYRCTSPSATITVDVRADVEPRVVFGPTDLVPEIVMAMDADTAHRLFLGDVNVVVALTRGLITAEGPSWKILKLVPLVKPAFPRYRALVEADGRAGLVHA